MPGSALGLGNPELRSDQIAEPPTEVGALLGLLQHCQPGCGVPEEAESPARRKGNAVAVGGCSNCGGSTWCFTHPLGGPLLLRPLWPGPAGGGPGRRARAAARGGRGHGVRRGRSDRGPPPPPRPRPGSAPGGAPPRAGPRPRHGAGAPPPKKCLFFSFFGEEEEEVRQVGTGISLTSGIIADPTLLRWPGSFRTVRRRRCKLITGSSSGGGTKCSQAAPAPGPLCTASRWKPPSRVARRRTAAHLHLNHSHSHLVAHTGGEKAFFSFAKEEVEGRRRGPRVQGHVLLYPRRADRRAVLYQGGGRLSLSLSPSISPSALAGGRLTRACS